MSSCNPADEKGENRNGQLQYHLDQNYLEFLKMNSHYIYNVAVPLARRQIKLSLCLTDKNYAIKAHGGSGCIDPTFLDISTSWR
jgi:hypothetical protein